jgi:uncharacterized protein (DUF885 family)
MAQSHQKSLISAAGFPFFVSDYLNDFHSRHPSLAAASGIHAWDGKLEDYSPTAITSEIAAIKKFQERLDKIPRRELPLTDALDYEILSANMKSRLLELEEIKSYQREPRLYSDVISTGLLQIATFDYAPLESRLRHVISKQNQIEKLIESARVNIGKVPPIFLKTGLDSFRGTLSFVQNDLPEAFAEVKNAKLQGDFRKSTKSASRAIASYIKQLERIKPDSSAGYALGKQKYELKLRYDEGIDIRIDVLFRIAYRELFAAQREFRETAAQIDSKREPLVVWRSIQSEHPKEGFLVGEAQKQLHSLLKFLDEKKLLTLPTGTGPVVARTPNFMRWATASMWTPGPFERANLPARYLITDVDPVWDARQKEEYLASFNYPQLWSTSIHEAYPGHYVQGAYLKQVTSQVRKTWALAPTSYVEGWAHYTEQMMIEQGFGDDDPKMKLGQLADSLLRLCRFVVGISLHTDGMSVDEATRFFMDNAFMGETPSRIEAERGTFDPGYILYAVGKFGILKLREDYKRYRRHDFSLQEFHDQLLVGGLAPLWVHRQMLMPGDKGKLVE